MFSAAALQKFSIFEHFPPSLLPRSSVSRPHPRNNNGGVQVNNHSTAAAAAVDVDADAKP